MNTKIQELTDIIYNEGVAKGQAEADQILAQAKEQAQKIIQDAQKEADAVLSILNNLLGLFFGLGQNLVSLSLTFCYTFIIYNVGKFLDFGIHRLIM